MDAEELEHKKELLEILKARKREREKQAALLGVSADPSINIELSELTGQIQAMEREITLAERPSQTGEVVRDREPLEDAPPLREPVPRLSNQRPVAPAVNHVPVYSEPHLPFSNRPWLLLAAVLAFGAIIFMFSQSRNPFLQPNSPTHSPTQRATQRTTLQSGDTWKKAGRELSLISYSFEENRVTLQWRFTNNSQIDVTVTSSSVKSLGPSSSSDGAQPKLSATCQSFDCDKNIVVKQRGSIEYSHILEYPSADLPRSLTVVTGYTNEVQWEISR